MIRNAVYVAVAGIMILAIGLDTRLLTDPQPEAPADRASAAPLAPSELLSTLAGGHPWLNTPPLRAEDLRGKVVLVNFWTYSCINSLRVLPYLRAWAEKYKDRGLVVVGVHSPEFTFEKDLANVTKASASLNVGYPVVLDNDFAIWRAFDNQAWPGFYFLGADGRVRRHVFGEGEYEQSERFIQRLLAETRGPAVTSDLAFVRGTGAQAAPDERSLRSPETYIGYAQARAFLSRDGVHRDAPALYRAASPLTVNHWTLSGTWTIGGELAALNVASGSISHRFHARDVHLVLGRAPQSAPGTGTVRFRVLIDGAPPGGDHGVDVDAEGWGSVQEDRMYQLVRQARPVVERTFEIQFLDAGVRAYSFTFG